MKKAIPVIVALVLIVLIGVGYGGKIMWDRYSYSSEKADLDEYYGVTEGQLAIILQDDRIPENALAVGPDVYFEYNTVKTYLNDGFYMDKDAGKLLYTTPLDIVAAVLGETEYSDGDGVHEAGAAACLQRDGNIYIAAE